MARVFFTKNLQRHVSAPETEAAGATVAEVFEAVFAENPQVRRYVLDDQGALRKHMAVFVNGEQVRDRDKLGDPVTERCEIYIMQALSGGQ